MRGKASRFVNFRWVRRITPAYAGKSLALCGAAGGFWDHPRLCGEKVIINDEMELEAGSPPPMRGKG